MKFCRLNAKQMIGNNYSNVDGFLFRIRKRNTREQTDFTR